MPVEPAPEGFHTVTPRLVVEDAAAAIDFYRRAFLAIENMRLQTASGRVVHAEIRLGDSIVIIADEDPESNDLSPTSLGGAGGSLQVYVSDVDAAVARAVAAGATIDEPLADQFFGERTCTLVDPFGHVWTLSTRKQDLTNEEIERRFRQMF